MEQGLILTGLAMIVFISWLESRRRAKHSARLSFYSDLQSTNEKMRAALCGSEKWKSRTDSEATS